MNLRDLNYFVTVAETKHFRHAAEKCFVSQPTLSGQIKKLEEELKVTLFERTNKSVALTTAGECLLVYARKVLSEASALKEKAQSFEDPLAIPQRIGILPTLCPYLLPLLLDPLHDSTPQLKFILTEEKTQNLLSRLKDHEIDAAFIATPIEEDGLIELPLFDEPFWLAHPRESDLYNHEGPFTQTELGNLNILLLADDHCLTDQVMEVCQLKERSQIGEMADLRAASLETLLQLVGAGVGCTLIPALALRGNWITDSGVIVQQLDLPDAYRTIRLIYRKSFSRIEALKILTQVILTCLPNTVKIHSISL